MNIGLTCIGGPAHLRIEDCGPRTFCTAVEAPAAPHLDTGTHLISCRKFVTYISDTWIMPDGMWRDFLVLAGLPRDEANVLVREFIDSGAWK